MDQRALIEGSWAFSGSGVWTKDGASIEFADAVPTSEGEGAVDFAAIELEHPMDALLSGAGHAPKMRPADQHRPRAERQRLHHVDPAAEAAIDQHRNSVIDRIDNGGQRDD